MKKSLFYSAIIMLSLFISCTDSAEKTEVNTENSGTTVKEPVPKNAETQTSSDTTKRTSVSVNSNGADVKHKNTQINVDKNGVKLGTKDVKIEIKK